MQTIEYILESLKWAHQYLEMAMEDVSEDQVHWTPPGSANPLGATYAHAVASVDAIVHGVLQGKPPLFSTTWDGKSGISAPQLGSSFQWARDLQVELPQAREYAQAVYASAENYIRSLEEADLQREVDLTDAGFGIRTVAWVLYALVISHMNNMIGEISVLKGIQGAKGYPF